MARIASPARVAVVASGLLAFLAGCSAKPAPKIAAAEPRPAATEAPVTVVNRPNEPGAVVAPAAEALPKSVDELNRRGYLKDAFFDFDEYAIRPDQRDVLSKDAAWLKKAPAVKILVEGHCDERGTSAYNMALGERRAEAAREYLEALGIPASRIQVISYGNERPFASGHDEQAWAQNRRDHVVVTAD